ncbi:hypothetical protein E2C01_093205 [Portunus trituberculatus]|uniref:Uncharacterized protein n=1 Tax=Portunus trituberculatus TaxID=210409 RepID=A0A5B7JXH7_PORTR|nr:hypothetical protein [Portunus trituberculatus]
MRKLGQLFSFPASVGSSSLRGCVERTTVEHLKRNEYEHSFLLLEVKLMHTSDAIKTRGITHTMV